MRHSRPARPAAARHPFDDVTRKPASLLPGIDDGDKRAKDVCLGALGERLPDDVHDTGRERLVVAVPGDGQGAAAAENHIRVRVVEHELEIGKALVQ